jgi:hypothetical protein
MPRFPGSERQGPDRMCRTVYAWRPGPGYVRRLHRARAGYRQPPRQALLAVTRVKTLRQTATLAGPKPVLDSPARSPPLQRCEGTGDRPVHSDLVDLRSTAISAQNATRRAESAFGVPAGAERTLPRSHCVARPPALGSLQPEGAGPLTGPRDGEQQISRHVTTASPIHWPQHLPAGRSPPPPCERASPGSQACALDRCAQSVRYDKTILVGTWHTSAPLRRDGSPDSPAIQGPSGQRGS